MNEKLRLKRILDDLGKQAFTDQIDGWIAVQTRLAQGRPLRIANPKAEQKSFRQVNAYRLSLGIALGLIVLATIIFTTPNREAFAEVLARFFRTAASTSIPIPTVQVPPTPTFAPTFDVRLIPARQHEMEAPGIPTPGPTEPFQPSLDPCQTDLNSYACKISRAEQAAGFDAKEFPTDPKGLFFQYIPLANPSIIMLEYVDIGGGGILDLMQGPGNEFPTFEHEVPEGTVEEVQVGDNRGEFVVGDYAIKPGETEYKWIPCCRYRLRWTEGDRWFELQRYGDPGLVKYGDRDILIQLALTLVDHPQPAQGPRAEYITILTEASQLAGFQIVAPTILPEGFQFSHASYDQALSQVKLMYYPGGDPNRGARILISETPIDKGQPDQLQGEQVDVNGHPAIYFSSDEYSHSLSWQAGELKIVLDIYSTKEIYGGGFSKDQVLEIARSLRP